MFRTMSNGFKERLQSAAELLESIAKNRELLAEVSEEEQRRLLRAAGEVYAPDGAARKRLVKANRKQQKATKIRIEESTLSKSGIRKLRRQTVFTTPNVFPPSEFEQQDVDDPDFRPSLLERLNAHADTFFSGSLNTRCAFSRRNLGHTWSRNGTAGISSNMRS